MGLFSSNYITTVGTTVQRAIEDKTIISSPQVGLTNALFSKEGQLVGQILAAMQQSIGVRVDRMYKYAKSTHTFGVPSTKLVSAATGKDVVLNTIRATNLNASEVYYHFGPLNLLHQGWVKLFTTYGYDSLTNKLTTLTTPNGQPAYLKDMVVVVQKSKLNDRVVGSLDLWGRAASSGLLPNGTRFPEMVEYITPSPVVVSDAIPGDSVMLIYCWMDGTVMKEDSLILFTLDYSLPKDTADYFHVKYALPTGKEGYWIYKLGAGTYPTIDAIYAPTASGLGSFFPITYFRHAGAPLVANSTAYKQSVEMTKLIGMDYDSVLKAINTNADISKVEQAMLVFAVSANTTHDLERKYLFDFFNKVYLCAGGIAVDPGWVMVGVVPRNDADFIITGESLTPEERRIKEYFDKQEIPKISLIIQDGKSKTGVSCQGIFKRSKAGKIADVEGYSSKFITETRTETYKKTGFVGDPIMWDSALTPTEITVSQDYSIDSHIYQHQITEDVYEEIQVYDLRVTYHIFNGYSAIGDNVDPILIIPLDYSITKDYSVNEKELLFSRAMHYIFNAKVITEVKWYEQAWFAGLIQFIGIAITLVSLGSDSGFFANLGAVIAGNMAIQAFVMYVAMAIVEMVLVTVALRLFVEAVGVDVAFIAAVIAAVYAGYQIYEAGSVKGAPWATRLLNFANGLNNAIVQNIQQSMLDLRAESEAFSLMAKEKWDDLKKLKEELEQHSVLSPESLLRLSPDELFGTVHYGNIGTLGIESIASYVDIALTLPDVNETIGSKAYV